MKKHKLIIFILIICLGIFFRFFRLTEVPLGLYPDEAMNGNNALEAQATRNYKFFYPENNGREGFFINMQSIALALVGNEPWALRGVSGVMGTLTILGVFLVTKELFSQHGNKRKRNAATTIALIAAFFTATSYWHVHFSRIGFRAIMFPLVTTFALYFLLKGLRTKRVSTLAIAGFFTGLGFHTYIAFRFFPFIAAIPLIADLKSYYRAKTTHTKQQKKSFDLSCSPCAATLYLFVTFVIALPIGVYFLQHPQDFIGRSNQVSIFATKSPVNAFIQSNIKTWGMIAVRGDCNWRHNYDCRPALVWPLALFFGVGMVVTIRNLFTRAYERSSTPLILLGWLMIMSLPATLTWEGLPHALRSIGMIPPIIILAALGCWRLVRAVLDWFERQKSRVPEKIMQITRVQKEIKTLVMLMLLLVPISTYRAYFLFWANNPNTYTAFSTDLYHIGQYVREKTPDITAYVVVNLDGTDVRGIPMPAQTVMFVTNTFQASEQMRQHIFYLRANQLDQIHTQKEQKTMIVFLNGDDKKTISALQKKFPDVRPRAPGDFIILENYWDSS